MARGLVAVEAEQRCACFSEIPLETLDRLLQRRSNPLVAFYRQSDTKERPILCCDDCSVGVDSNARRDALARTVARRWR